MAEPQPTASGKWTQQVTLPDGTRPRITHESKTEVRRLADETRVGVKAGDWIDPRGAKMHVAEIWDDYRTALEHEENTGRRHQTAWRNQVGPRWATTPIGDVLAPDVSKWVAELQQDGLGSSAIGIALDVLSKVFKLAIAARKIRHNPVKDVKRPRRNVPRRRLLTADEEHALLEALDLLFPGRFDARPFVELLLDTGGRWSDAAGIRKVDVDRFRKIANLTGVMTRSGKRRGYLKGEGQEGDGGRTCPLTDDTLTLLAPRLDVIGTEDLVYCSPGENFLRYNNWKPRVWDKAIAAARLCPGTLDDCDVRLPTRSKHDNKSRYRRVEYCQNEDHGIPAPRPTPHDCRRTFGSRLGEANVPHRDIEALLGLAPGSPALAAYVVASDARLDKARSVVRSRR